MRTEIDKAIISNVKTLRKELGISQQKLAVIIGTSPAFIAKVENPNFHHKYSTYHLYLIAEDFDCEFSELYPPIKRKG